MANLKIINSPNLRILTQCEHCLHVMKTSADTLYYLVECPSCTKDFVVRRYQKGENQIQRQVQQVGKNIKHGTKYNNDEAYISTVYRLSWPVYKTGIVMCLIFGASTYGFSYQLKYIFLSLLVIFLLTIVHYIILCAGGVYYKCIEK